MKILEILNKIAQHQKHLEKKGMLKEAAEIEETKNKLISYVNSEVLSKRDANEQWEVAGNDISSYIEKIISLLSVIGTKSREELEEYYDTNKLKTIYYLIHNSNLMLNGIAQGMRDSNIGYLPRYHSTHKDKKTGLPKRLEKDDEQNTDLYHLLMSYLSYEKGQYVQELFNFFSPDKENKKKDRRISVDAILRDAVHYNDLYSVLNVNLPKELLVDIAQMRGSAGITRGNFEFLFTLLFEGGKFGKLPVDANGEENGGDIILNNKAIEIKVDTGSGGGRIGGQKGFTAVESVVGSYIPKVMEFAKYMLELVNEQAGDDEDTNASAAEFEGTVTPYIKGTIQFGINQNTAYKGKYELIDTALLKIVSSAKNILGSFTPEQTNKILNDITTIYSSIWLSLIPTKNGKETLTHKRMRNIIAINVPTTENGLEDLLNRGTIIPKEYFYDFSQAMCFVELAEYAAQEKFHYIFVIKTDSSLQNASMSILSNNAIQKAANSFDGIRDIISKTNIKFGLPSTYGAASRAIRPDITLA